MPLNQDIMDWANSWNNHKMSIRSGPNQGSRSPTDLRWFSMLQDGARGFQPVEPSSFEPMDETLDPENIPEYGIDWNAYENDHIQEHHALNNPADPFPNNPFVAHQPEVYSMVNVDETRCPFTDQEYNTFRYHMSLLPDTLRFSQDMNQRKQLWIVALGICQEMMR